MIFAGLRRKKLHKSTRLTELFYGFSGITSDEKFAYLPLVRNETARAGTLVVLIFIL
jgi:hypothetical protein